MATLEPVYMSDKNYDILVNSLRESYPNACVLYIDRVNNKALLESFIKYRDSLNNPNERRLYHGTSEYAVRSICNEGYKEKYSKVKVYGHGTYFSSAGSYSKNYSKETGNGESFMIVNRVALGPNVGGDGKTIFVTPDDDAAYPEYVICFHKNAEVAADAHKPEPRYSSKT
jgi:hypothetical protein